MRSAATLQNVFGGGFIQENDETRGLDWGCSTLVVQQFQFGNGQSAASEACKLFFGRQLGQLASDESWPHVEFAVGNL